MAKTQTATPTADKPKAKPKRNLPPGSDKFGRVPYPGIQKDAEGNPIATITAKPVDYSAGKHQPLSRGDFVEEHVYYDWQADLAEARARRMRQKAETCKVLGNTEDRKNVQKGLRLSAQLEDLKKTLTAKGINFEDFMKSMGGGDAE